MLDDDGRRRDRTETSARPAPCNVIEEQTGRAEGRRAYELRTSRTPRDPSPISQTRSRPANAQQLTDGRGSNAAAFGPHDAIWLEGRSTIRTALSTISIVHSSRRSVARCCLDLVSGVLLAPPGDAARCHTGHRPQATGQATAQASYCPGQPLPTWQSTDRRLSKDRCICICICRVTLSLCKSGTGVRRRATATGPATPGQLAEADATRRKGEPMLVLAEPHEASWAGRIGAFGPCQCYELWAQCTVRLLSTVFGSSVAWNLRPLIRPWWS